MAPRKGPPGHCAICGTFTEQLSYEHVPPAAAFNRFPTVAASMDLYLADRDGMFKHGERMQRGGGAFTLCSRCNNDTGAWYGCEYAAWAKSAFELLSRFPRNGEHVVTMSGVRPLRFIKQVITMLFSVNGPKFRGLHPELVQFVLDRHRKGLPPRYEVYMTLVRSGYSRVSGVSGIASVGGGLRVVSEIVHVPFALLVTFDTPASSDVGRITRFGAYGVDERADVSVNLTAGEAHTPYPADYRTRAEVDAARAKASVGPPQATALASPEVDAAMRSSLTEFARVRR